jgi:hypothetical protein
VLNARSRSWHASLATAGCEAREEAQGPVFHPLATGKGKAGRANDVNLCKPRYREHRRWVVAPVDRTRRWEAAVVAGVSLPAMGAPRSRGIGDARHRPHLTSAEHGNPVTVRRNGPAAGRPTAREAEIRGGNRTAKKPMAACRKAAGKRRCATEPSTCGRRRITGRIPGRVPGPERELT